MVSSDAELPVSHQASRASRASRVSKQLTVSLAKEAKDKAEAHMDEMLRHGDAAFQVADECLGAAWNASAVGQSKRVRHGQLPLNFNGGALSRRCGYGLMRRYKISFRIAEGCKLSW